MKFQLKNEKENVIPTEHSLSSYCETSDKSTRLVCGAWLVTRTWLLSVQVTLSPACTRDMAFMRDPASIRGFTLNSGHVSECQF